MTNKRHKPDYVHKAEVMKTNLPQLERDTSKALYACENGLNWKVKYDYDTALDLRCFLMDEKAEEWKEAIRINDASYHRVKRLKKRISCMLDKPCIFITLTFTDDVFAKTSAETRKDYVRRYLCNLGVAYVANIDFGKKHEREHYHAVVQAENIDYKPWHKYGAIKGEKVRLDYDENGKCKDEIRLAKYISKLTNHAIKETCKRSCIMYSRESRREPSKTE